MLARFQAKVDLTPLQRLTKLSYCTSQSTRIDFLHSSSAQIGHKMSNGEGPIERVPEQQYFVRVEVRLLTFCPSARSIVQHFKQPTRQAFTLKNGFLKATSLWSHASAGSGFS